MGAEEVLQLLTSMDNEELDSYSFAQIQPDMNRATRRKILNLVALALVLSSLSSGVAFITFFIFKSSESISTTDSGAKATSLDCTSTPSTPEKSHLPEAFNVKVLSCGDDMEQALEKDCVYDVMLPAWVPKPCFNSSLHDEFINSKHGYKWYRNLAAINEVALSSIETGRYSAVYTSHEFRVHHCQYIWRKQIATMELDGSWIEDQVMSPQHSRRCASWMNNKPEDSNGSSVVTIQSFQNCRRYSMSIVY